MDIIIGDAQHIPTGLKRENYEVWSVPKFIEIAEKELNITGSLYMNMAVVPEALYNALYDWRDQINIVPFHFVDQPMPAYKLHESTIVNQYQLNPEPDKVIDMPLDEPTDTTTVLPKVEEKPKVEKPVEPKPAPAPKPKPKPKPKTIKPDIVEEKPKQPKVETITEEEPEINTSRLYDLLTQDDLKEDKPRDANHSAKVILFGSSKGGTGKTCTCLMSAYRYAKTHPHQKVAVADFDIIDGQIGIILWRSSPTFVDFYRNYKAGNTSFDYLANCKIKNDHFSDNLDFYLACPADIPEITKDDEFWLTVYTNLIKNYDVVFFDSGTNYIGIKPISNLYKIATKVIITCNPSIHATRSVWKQLQCLSGERKNNAFKPADNILEKTSIVLTRVSADKKDAAINKLVEECLTPYAPIIMRFQNIDSLISRMQWSQMWEVIDSQAAICEGLDKITEL